MQKLIYVIRPIEKIIIISTLLIALGLNAWNLAYQSTRSTEDRLFIGSYPILFDLYTYYTKMSVGSEGSLLYENRYTTEPGSSRAPIYLFYVALGHLSRLTHISIIPFFFIARLVFGLIYISTLLVAIRFFISEERIRLIAYPLLVFGTGFSFLGLGSADWFLYDLIPSARFLYFPHITLGNTLFLLSLMLVISGRRRGKWNLIFGGGICALLLFFILPFHLYTLLPLIQVVFVYDFITRSRQRIIRDWLLFHCLVLPGIVVLLLPSVISPIWSEYQKHLLHYKIPFWKRAFGLGLFIPMGIWAFIYAKNIPLFIRTVMGIWSAWIFVFPEIALVPGGVRAFEAMPTFPLGILSAFGIAYYLQKRTAAHPKAKRLDGLSLAPILLPLAILLFASNITHIQAIRRAGKSLEDPRYFLSSEIIDVGNWIDQNINQDRAVLSSFADGNILPFYGRRKVYLGQDPETLNFFEKNEIVEKILRAETTPDQLKSLMIQHRIGVVVLRAEDMMGAASFLSHYSFLREGLRTQDYLVLVPSLTYE